MSIGILDMLGDELKALVLAARSRTGDATIMASCTAGLWSIERADGTVATGLAYEDLLTQIEGLA